MFKTSFPLNASLTSPDKVVKALTQAISMRIYLHSIESG